MPQRNSFKGYHTAGYALLPKSSCSSFCWLSLACGKKVVALHYAQVEAFDVDIKWSLCCWLAQLLLSCQAHLLLPSCQFNESLKQHILMCVCVCVGGQGWVRGCNTICGSLLPRQPANKSDKLQADSFSSASLTSSSSCCCCSFCAACQQVKFSVPVKLLQIFQLVGKAWKCRHWVENSLATAQEVSLGEETN